MCVCRPAHGDTGFFWDTREQTVILKSFAHMDRGKNWCFTHYEELPIPFDDESMSYIIQQREICPTSGREHWQGTFVLRNAKTFTGVRRMLPGTHLEKCRDITHSIAYCSKEDTRKPGTSPIEQGEKPGGEDWRGMPYEELWEKRSGWMLRNWRAVREYQSTIGRPDMRPNHKMFVYYGPPGSGKSHRAYTENPDAYSKDGSKWWDGYTGQTVVIWDDFAGTIPFRDFLRWTDKYPQRVEVKGGSVALKHDKTFVTTNVLPINWYPNCDYNCIKRRIHELYEFDLDYSYKIIDA